MLRPVKRNPNPREVIVKKTPIEEYYTTDRLQSIITWRKKRQGKSLCQGFCKKHDTDQCPQNGNLPAKGHCPYFAFKGQTLKEAQELLAADAWRSGIKLQIFAEAS